MKKIPTLFKRLYDNNRQVGIINELSDDKFQWVLDGLGVATEKIDGSCTMIKDNIFYKRYDAKHGKRPPSNAIPCIDSPDPITGHWPHWLEVDLNKSENKWFINAYNNTPYIVDGTYEAIGPHFQNNPYSLSDDILERHGVKEINVKRSFNDIRNYLKKHCIEGIVFWKDGEPQCKIKRKDFGFEWPIKY